LPSYDRSRKASGMIGVLRRLAVGAIAGLVAFAAAPVSAQTAVRPGTAGYCPDGDGVTVVVDFQELGGTTIVRCAPGGQQTGHEALKNAGIQTAGTSRWGEAFVCRIEGVPGPNAESCKDTPPSGAFWSYWYAPNGGAWKYSEMGVMNRQPPPGSFEGWSFSKNKTETTYPPPRIAPARPVAPPATPPKTPAAPPAGGVGNPPPPGNKPPANQPGGNQPAAIPPAGNQPSSAPSDVQPSSTPEQQAVPGTTTTETSITAPPTAGTAANGVEWTGDPGLASNNQSGGTPWMVVLGGVVILSLATGAGVTIRRRKRAES
jgi:hypothetical protein